jgi:hypothetical protein
LGNVFGEAVGVGVDDHGCGASGVDELGAACGS